VPSENEVATERGSESSGRVQRKRAARREQLLDLAADLVEQHGVAGLTMAALAEASDYAPASLYTYFDSRSALLAALQTQALQRLGEVGEAALAAWDAHLAAAGTPASPAVAALARLCGFSDLFLAAPHQHPREFRLQQELLVTGGSQDPADSMAVLPAALQVLELPRRLIAAAVEAAALEATGPVADPTGSPLDGAYLRTVAWVAALNGALLVDALNVGTPTTGAGLGTDLTDALLRGWGADADALRLARSISADWVG
jgi:AcrR family transcriptional regulator